MNGATFQSWVFTSIGASWSCSGQHQASIQLKKLLQQCLSVAQEMNSVSAQLLDTPYTHDGLALYYSSHFQINVLLGKLLNPSKTQHISMLSFHFSNFRLWVHAAWDVYILLGPSCILNLIKFCTFHNCDESQGLIRPPNLIHVPMTRSLLLMLPIPMVVCKRHITEPKMKNSLNSDQSCGCL